MRGLLRKLSTVLICPIDNQEENSDQRFNYVLGVINGAIFMFGFSFLHPNTVLPVFVRQLTESNVLVGLASAIQRAGWLLPQLLVAGYAENLTYKRGLYIRANAVRLVLTWLIIPLLACCAVSRPHWTLAGFLVLSGIAAVFGGLAAVPYSDIVGKTIPGPYFGQFFATRLFLGAGLSSILAGFLVRYLLSEDSPHVFPGNFIIVFSIGAALMTIGILCYIIVREPPGKVSRRRRTFVDIVGNIPSILRKDRQFRLLLLVLVLASGLGFSLPFYIVLVQERFGASSGVAGTFLATQTLGVLLSNLFWAWLSRRSGNLSLIRVTTFGQILIPVYTLGLVYLMADTLQGSPSWVVSVAFSPVFFLIGAFISGGYIGYNSLLLSMAPEERRPTYIGVTNSLMGAAALYPLLGGIIVEFLGINMVFFLAALLCTGGFLVCLTLTESRGRKSSG